MSIERDPPAPQPPSAADYQTLAAQLTAVLHAFAAREVDARAFRERIDAVRAEIRALDLLRRLHSASRRLAAQQQNASKSGRNCL